MKGELRITNRTGWKTRDLRRVFVAVLRENKKTEGPLRHALRVTVVHSRGTYVCGYAFLRSGTMRLRLPSPKRGPLDVFEAGWLFDHELAHCRGHVHKVMGRLNNVAHATPANYPFLAGLAVAPVAPKARPAVDIRAVRAARVAARLKTWEAKERRARRAAAKCRAALRRYEKAGIAAAA